mmetsp:Transcript_114945/g.371600  ORF Transcript_114945/g.371600 Transcript_114945/m.371600 type:complete len:300 (-) Transcript_114945:250-1149(-)
MATNRFRQRLRLHQRSQASPTSLPRSLLTHMSACLLQSGFCRGFRHHHLRRSLHSRRRRHPSLLQRPTCCWHPSSSNPELLVAQEARFRHGVNFHQRSLTHLQSLTPLALSSHPLVVLACFCGSGSSMLHVRSSDWKRSCLLPWAQPWPVIASSANAAYFSPTGLWSMWQGTSVTWHRCRLVSSTRVRVGEAGCSAGPAWHSSTTSLWTCPSTSSEQGGQVRRSPLLHFLERLLEAEHPHVRERCSCVRQCSKSQSLRERLLEAEHPHMRKSRRILELSLQLQLTGRPTWTRRLELLGT